MTGTLWTSGLHHVYVDDEPARVFVPQYTITDTFNKFKQTIDREGGITLGLDHIPPDLLEDYPILKKLDPLNVGKVTQVQTDGERIYATQTEHSNPIVRELYEKGDLPAYSVVASTTASPCENGKADYVFEHFNKIERMDYVDEGGCKDCKVEQLPDDLILTARLSTEHMEEDSVTKEEIDAQATEETQEVEEVVADAQTDNEELETQVEPEVTEEPEMEPEITEPRYVTQEVFDKAISGLKDLIVTEPAKMEAKLATLELEAKKARVTPIVEHAIKEGRILPVDKDLFIAQGVELEDDQEFKEMMAKRPVIVELEAQHSKHGEPKDDDEVMDKLEKMGYFS